MWIENGIVRDAGSSDGGLLTHVGITNGTSEGFGINSGPITAPYTHFGIQVSPNGQIQFVFEGVDGGAAAQLSYVINGVTYSFPGSGSGDVTGPDSSVDGDIAVFNGTTGKLLRDSGGAPQFTVTSIAALRALDAKLPVVTVDGYYAPGDQGGGVFAYISGDTTSADNGGTIIVDAGGHRYYRQTPYGVNVRMFGAKGDGVTDDHAAIQATINYLATIGGGDVQLSADTFAIAQTLAISSSSIRLKGEGMGAWHDFPTEGAIAAATVLKWTGAAEGTMVLIQPAADSIQNLDDNGTTGIFYDAGTGAAYAVRALSTNNGVYRIAGEEFTQAMLYTGAVTWLGTPGAQDYADFQNNDIWLYGKNINTVGSVLICDGAPKGNTSFNRFHEVVTNYNHGHGVVLVNADNNTFSTTRLFRWPGGSGYGIVLSASDQQVTSTRANLFEDCSPGLGGVYAEGTEKAAVPAQNNSIVWYDQENGAPAPAFGSGATLSWSGNNAPFGFRQFALHVANVLPSVYTNMGGIIVQQGWTDLVGPGATLNITLPIPFTQGPMNVSLTPANEAVLYAAQCSSTTLTVTNGDGAKSTAFWYRVEGF